MHPVIHETPLGAPAGLTQFTKEHAPEVVPRKVAADAEEPDLASLALEATVSYVVVDEVQADLGIALACVGLRTDFEGDAEPEVTEPTPPLPENLGGLWPELVKATAVLARACARDLSLG